MFNDVRFGFHKVIAVVPRILGGRMARGFDLTFSETVFCRFARSLASSRLRFQAPLELAEEAQRDFITRTHIICENQDSLGLCVECALSIVFCASGHHQRCGGQVHPDG